VTRVDSVLPDVHVTFIDKSTVRRRAMAGATLKRYIATIVCKPGTTQETTRDNAEILAAGDDEAVRQAQDWIRRSGTAQNGDFLIVAENGRGVRSIEVKPPSRP
jgi:selenophosphate synthetase-related protein